MCSGCRLQCPSRSPDLFFQAPSEVTLTFLGHMVLREGGASQRAVAGLAAGEASRSAGGWRVPLGRGASTAALSPGTAPCLRAGSSRVPAGLFPPPTELPGQNASRATEQVGQEGPQAAPGSREGRKVANPAGRAPGKLRPLLPDKQNVAIQVLVTLHLLAGCWGRRHGAVLSVFASFSTRIPGILSPVSGASSPSPCLKPLPFLLPRVSLLSLHSSGPPTGLGPARPSPANPGGLRLRVEGFLSNRGPSAWGSYLLCP